MTRTRAHDLDGVARERLSIPSVRPEQREVIERVLSGGDAMVVWPTGSGKSLCFQLPALMPATAPSNAPDDGSGPGVTLVFSPLIALMEDQVAALRSRGVRAAYINSTLGRREREDRQRALAEGAYELIYATPERMERPGFAEALARVPGGVSLLAIDECHCVSKWGHDLRPAYQRIGAFREQLGNPVTIALTATATREVRDDVRRVLGNDEASMPGFLKPVGRPNLRLRARGVWSDADKVARIAEVAGGFDPPGTGIVYYALIKDLERAVPEVRRALDGRPVEMYHGRLDPREKKRVYERFVGSGPSDGLVLLATNAFGMGVDKPDIRFIVHAQTPGSVEAYAQEVGRAGRDGEPSVCELLYSQDDLAIQRDFAEWQNPGPAMLREVVHAIEGDGHADCNAEELKSIIFGKRGGHGTVAQLGYALIDLEKRGVVESTGVSERGERTHAELPRYRLVRSLPEEELDGDELDAKRQRDLVRLLRVVEMAKSGNVSGFVEDYFAD